MADRIIQDLSDARLRSGDSPEATMEFLQLNSSDVCKWDDDFLSGVLTSSVYTSASGSGATAFAHLAGSASANEWGVIRLITGTTVNVGGALSLGLQCRGEYNAVMAVRYKTSSAAELHLEIGFRDTVADSTSTLNNIDTPTFNASNACCWAYNTAGSQDAWEALGVKAGTAASGTTLSLSGTDSIDLASGVLPVAATYQTMVVAMMEDSAYFMRYNADGRKQGETILVSASQTETVNLAPFIYVQGKSSGASKNIDVDFFKVWQLRRS
jgi:hypothetical protein